MAAKKAEVKAEEKTEVKAEVKTEAKPKENKIPSIDELYKMKFTDRTGRIVMVRKAYGGMPKGRLEIYCPPQEQKHV